MILPLFWIVQVISTVRAATEVSSDHTHISAGIIKVSPALIKVDAVICLRFFWLLINADDDKLMASPASFVP